MAMGDVIGRLSVVLGLDTAAFESGARRSAKVTNDTGDRMEKLGARVGTVSKSLIGLGAAIVGSHLVGQLKDMTMEGLKYASSLGEQAQQLGVLSSELQEYRYAASQAGIETSEMDQALGQLTKRIGLAATGVGGPARAFAELGISVRNSKGEIITAGQAIPLIADALAKIPDPATRARLEVELFGKSGQKLDPLLTEGAAGVNKLRAAAHELGIVLSDEAIANADKTADKMDAMNQVLKAQIASFVAENAKEILALASALLELAGAAVKALNRWLDLKKGLATRDSIIAGAERRIDESGLSAQEKAAAKRRVPGIVDRRAHRGDRTIGPSWLGLKAGKPDYSQLSASGGAQVDGRSLSSFALGGTNRVSALMPSEQEMAALEELRDALGGVKISTTGLGEESSDVSRQMRDSWNETTEVMIAGLDRVTNAFRSGNWVDQVAALIGFGLQIKGAFFSGGSSLSGLTNSMAGLLKGPIPGFATGTSFAPGGLALVGERGPELVNLPRGSQVIPNHALNSGGGTRVEVIPSPYFDVRVHENISARAPSIAAAGARGGAQMVFARQRRSVG